MIACALCGYIVITMTVDLIKIGNSKGIRIPKPVIEQCGFKDKVQLHVEKDRLVISPARRPRQGWAEAFQRMADAGHDKLILAGAYPNVFDREEWEW